MRACFGTFLQILKIHRFSHEIFAFLGQAVHVIFHLSFKRHFRDFKRGTSLVNVVLLLTHQTINETTRAAMTLFLGFVNFCDTLAQRTPPELFHLVNCFRKRKLIVFFKALL